MFKLPSSLSFSTRLQSHLISRSYSSKTTTTSNAPIHFLTLADLSRPQILGLVSSALAFKRQANTCQKSSHPLLGDTVAMLFSKRSTRTRVATETAAAYLGARAMYLQSDEIQNEPPIDTARVISSMTGGIMARVNAHSEVETLAKNSAVPVINALSDKYHPTQILADLMTLHEIFTSSRPEEPASLRNPAMTLPGIRVAWVGDANNILNEFLVTMPKLGLHLQVATPKNYEILPDVRAIAVRDSANSKTDLLFTHSPEEAVKNADIIVTDTWVSMGQEEEKATRLKDFSGFRVTMDLARRGGAHEDWKFMHCLPRKQEEVDDEVFYSRRSVVFQEAENRKWTILAVLNALLVEGRYPTHE